MKVIIALIENYHFTLEPVSLGIPGIAATARKLEDVGFDGILSPETAGHDPFFPLLIAAEHTQRISLHTGIAVAFPRSPMVVAQMAWDLQRFSGGRFNLGLGTQVKAHNERRYGTPWTGPPGPRMREYVHCLQAIFKTFQNNKQPTYYEGKYYKYTMSPPVLTAGAIEHPHIPIRLAANNPYMARLAGELCDGVFAHPVCTAKYIREMLRPQIEAGARKGGRPMSQIDIMGAPIIVTGKNEAELQKERQLLKRRVAFYASTRTYHPMFEIHGWKEIGLKLHALSLENKWDEMVKLIPDEMAQEFGMIGHVDEIGAQLKERWGDILTTISLPTDFPLHTAEDQKRARAIIELLHGSTP